jgi:molybdopterin biosynthesis enzyme
MMRTPPPTGALTSLDAALAALLDGVAPVAPSLAALDQAFGRIAAEMPALPHPQPAHAIAASDGWACRALDLVGASPYSPVALSAAPAWVEWGDMMPQGCDCVLRADLVDCSGPIPQAAGEAAPGEGVRRAGEHIAAGRPVALAGRSLSATDLLVARKAGYRELAVRAPRVRVIDVAASNNETFSTCLIADSLKASGATVVATETKARNQASIAAALDGEACDLLLLIGGTGDGRTDVTAEALARRGVLLAHRIAIRPGGTTAIGRLGGMPIVALPGSPDQAFAAFLALVQPVLDRLAGRSERRPVLLPLSRKIASTVGIGEIALLRQDQGGWTPLAVGDFSLEAMRLAEAWLAIPGGSEGYAAGAPATAVLLRNPN